MQELLKILSKAEKDLTELIADVSARNKNLPQDSHLRTSSCRNTPTYYEVQESGENAKNRYIRKAEIELARNLAQKEYNDDIIDKATKQLHSIQNAIATLSSNQLTDSYSKLTYQRKILVTPAVLTDDEYAEEWLKQNNRCKEIRNVPTEIITQRGETVRSKSEKSIADMLDRLNIPYFYEFPLKLGNVTIHPDFTILNKRLRKVFYLEHLGMLDSINYVEDALVRVRKYEKSGIILGDQLLLTHETSTKAIDTRTLERMCRHFFL